MIYRKSMMAGLVAVFSVLLFVDRAIERQMAA
jgi:hypothetical protein